MKLFAFTVSAVMAGIAGALYVPQVGIINPSEFEPANSIEVVIWTAVGGRGTIVGPVLGRAARQLRRKAGSPARCPEFWLFALGGLFVVVTLFLPRGIVGLWDSGWSPRDQTSVKADGRPASRRRSSRRAQSAARPQPPQPAE